MALWLLEIHRSGQIRLKLGNISLQIKTGGIHALLGANGAGKSTLMKVLSGANPSYTGEVRINGEAVQLRTPSDARKYGIQIVYQEVDAALVPSLSVAENIFLDDLSEKNRCFLFVNWGRMYREADELLSRLKVKLDVRTQLDNLSLAQKQMVLIARALKHRCRFLLLDEPTAPLSREETETLFQICRYLIQHENMAIVLISHRLREVLQICGDYMVIRNGKLVDRAVITPDTTPDELIEKMLDGHPVRVLCTGVHEPGNVALETEHLSSVDGSLKDISLSLRCGEVVGIAGLAGAGKSELCKALFGEIKRSAGVMKLYGKEVEIRNPSDAVRHGIGLVPEERNKEGVFASESIALNLTAANLRDVSRYGFVSRKRVETCAVSLVQKLNIQTPSIRRPVGFLSGGNQQKVVVGKWLAADCGIYLFDEPTKGMDIGAKTEMLRLIRNLAESGCAVLYASCEYEELLSVTDRVYVLSNGRVTSELLTCKTSEEELLYHAQGSLEPFLQGKPGEEGKGNDIMSE